MRPEAGRRHPSFEVATEHESPTPVGPSRFITVIRPEESMNEHARDAAAMETGPRRPARPGLNCGVLWDRLSNGQIGIGWRVHRPASPQAAADPGVRVGIRTLVGDRRDATVNRGRADYCMDHTRTPDPEPDLKDDRRWSPGTTSTACPFVVDGGHNGGLSRPVTREGGG